MKAGDAVVGAVITDGTKKLFLIKKNAKGFRFDENLFTVHNRGVGGEKATSVTGPEEEVLGMKQPTMINLSYLSQKTAGEER